VIDAAACTFLHEGRLPDLRCKCEVGVRQQRELTFRLPKNSVFFCTAARPLRAQCVNPHFVLRALAAVEMPRERENTCCRAVGELAIHADRSEGQPSDLQSCGRSRPRHLRRLWVGDRLSFRTAFLRHAWRMLVNAFASRPGGLALKFPNRHRKCEAL
jgi:hypothetical protein